MRGVLPSMRERGGGRIVNIASSSIKQPIENLILSNTFRAGIAGLAKSLAIELAPDGILVNTIGPGRISTARSQSMDASRAEALGVPVEEVRGQVESQIPLGRYGTPRSSRGWRLSSPRRPTPESKSTKLSELAFHALLTDVSRQRISGRPAATRNARTLDPSLTLTRVQCPAIVGIA